MIGWVDEQCKAWSAHRRWLELGSEHGWPSRSILGRLIEEGPGAGHVPFGTRIPIRDDPPSYTLVTLALMRMAETHQMELPHIVVRAHYLFAGKARGKATDLKMSLRQYWQHLHAAHAFISACSVPRGAEVCALEKHCA